MKTYRSLLVALCCAAALPTAVASISSAANAELILVLWDPVAKVSYTKDLGLNTYFGSDPTLRRQSFFVYAQQDTGYQEFWNLDAATDPNFAQFRSVATTTANIVWAILGQDSESDSATQSLPGDQRTFLTLKAGTQAGVKSNAYSNLEAFTNGDFASQVGGFETDFLNPLNVGTKPFNTHVGSPASANGSSFDAEGTEAYFGKSGGIYATYGASCNCTVSNSVGSSSWFYYITRSNDFSETDPILIDEFDNLGHDGYFGFAQKPANGSFVLSYTLAASVQSAAASTVAGKARASLTEYIASSSSRLLTAPAGEFASYVAPLSPVPEPSSILLMASGLAGLACLRRRRALSGRVGHTARA